MISRANGGGQTPYGSLSRVTVKTVLQVYASEETGEM